MSNSIDNNLRVNNSISDLTFFWQGIFKDSLVINQIDEDGTEHRFQEIRDKFSELAFFNLSNKQGKMFTVNLLEGIIGYNDFVISYRKSEIKKNNIRLIYFRRNYVTIGTKDLKTKNHIIIYYLGYQYLDNNGHNRKVIHQIDQEGNWISES